LFDLFKEVHEKRAKEGEKRVREEEKEGEKRIDFLVAFLPLLPSFLFLRLFLFYLI
jgi:hypothetical protein